jgi:hypothetical protein
MSEGERIELIVIVRNWSLKKGKRLVKRNSSRAGRGAVVDAPSFSECD